MRDIAQNIAQNWQHLKSNPIYIACSGGLDSTVLLSILHSKNFNINVIHVNYHLRGEDSDLDEAFIRDFCKESNIKCEVKSIELAEKLSDGGNLQQLAREVRYVWFEEIISKNPEAYIFLAHHSDDQVETFFLNLARKSGVMGLACMPPERNHIVRPLLAFSKDDLKRYAKENNIQWREDMSNETNKYRRNFLRNEVLPYLSGQIPELIESVTVLIEKFQEKQKSLESEVQPIINHILDKQQVDFDTIRNLDEFQLHELFRQIGQPNQKATQLMALLDTQKGKKVELLSHPSNPFASIVREENTFSFISNTTKNIEFNLITEVVESLPLSFNKNEIYLDTEKIRGELKIRPWQEADRIHSIGMKGSQLISDIISDAKLSAIEKQNVLIVHDDETIHWCVGMKVGRKAIASSDSNKTIRVTVTSVTQ